MQYLQENHSLHLGDNKKYTKNLGYALKTPKLAREACNNEKRTKE